MPVRLSGCCLVVCAVLACSAPVLAQNSHEAAYQKLIAEWKAKAGDVTFDKANADAIAAWDARQEAGSNAELTEDPKEKAKLQKQQAEAEIKALALLQAALAVAPADSNENKDQLAQFRYNLALLYYIKKDWKHAAIVGEYLARKNPQQEEALEGAKIATAAYTMQYNETPQDQKTKAVEPLLAINEYIASQWKDREEGKEALGRLAGLALATGDQAKALKIAEKLPATSPQRGEIQLRFGLAAWNELLQQKALPEKDPKRPSPAELDKSMADVKKLLLDATTQTRKTSGGQTSQMLAIGELTLAQIYNEQNLHAETIKLLETPKTGLLDLSLAGDPVMKENDLATRVYNLALRSYVAQQDLVKAERMLEQLSGADGDQAKLTKMQLSLANSLYKEIEADRAKGDTTALSKKLQGLTGLLDKVSKRKEGHDFRSQTWVAQTLFELASDMDAGGPQADDQVAKLYSKAAGLYQILLDKGISDPNFVGDPKNLLGLRVQLAKCQRRLGLAAEALSMLEDVLKVSPKNLDAQYTGAAIYEEWGERTDDMKYFQYAVTGGPQKKIAGGVVASPIMGFSKLAVLLYSSPKNRDRYLDVRYHIAYCTARAALLNKQEAERKNQLATAEKVILLTQSVSPQLGSPELYAKFEALLKSVQGKQGKKEEGFAVVPAAPVKAK